jgi:hypothetical protein
MSTVPSLLDNKKAPKMNWGLFDLKQFVIFEMGAHGVCGGQLSYA